MDAFAAAHVTRRPHARVASERTCCTSSSKHLAYLIRRGSSSIPIRATYPSRRASFSRWTRRVLGDRVSLLDGGMQAWQRSGNAMTKDVPVVTQGKLAPLSMQQRVVDAAFVQQHLQGAWLQDHRCARASLLRRRPGRHGTGARETERSSARCNEHSVHLRHRNGSDSEASGRARGRSSRQRAWRKVTASSRTATSVSRPRRSYSPRVRSASTPFCTTAPFRIGHDAGCRSKFPPRRRRHERAASLRQPIRRRMLSRTGLARRVRAHRTRARRFRCVRQRRDGTGGGVRTRRTCDATTTSRRYAASGAPWTAWMVVEVLGIVVGAAISAAMSGRLRIEVQRRSERRP